MDPILHRYTTTATPWVPEPPHDPTKTHRDLTEGFLSLFDDRGKSRSVPDARSYEGTVQIS